MAGVAFDAVSKRFDAVEAVRELTLGASDGEFLVLVGPSGSGKTTALRMIAGLEDVSSGEILIGREPVTGRHPMDRDIAMVFQSYALYPHMTVFENMAFGLKLHRVKKKEARRRVEAAAQVLGIEKLLKRKPGQLSGGQRQRVAMGRAIVREPAAFLMDEPLSNLDAQLRVEMRAEIQKLQHRLGATTIYVTHDQTEAMTMADRVAVMRDGAIVQVDSPRRLYERPRDVFVARFIGSPAMNLLHARLSRSNGSVTAELGPLSLSLPARALPASVEDEVILGIRPEHLADADLAGAENGRPTLEAPVSIAEPLGAEVITHFELDPEHTLIARLDPKTRAEAGRRMRLLLDPDSLYFFDPESEQAIYP
jgi:multiple sugar transport system ATP-binding protein